MVAPLLPSLNVLGQDELTSLEAVLVEIKPELRVPEHSGLEKCPVGVGGTDGTAALAGGRRGRGGSVRDSVGGRGGLAGARG